MPAAAVTPAPVAYIKVVAVKKLVVGYLALIPDPFLSGNVVSVAVLAILSENLFNRKVIQMIWIFYFEKIRVFKAGITASEYISME